MGATGDGGHGGEQGEEGIELTQRLLHPLGFAERHLDVATGQAEPALGEASGERFAVAEVTERSEVDPGVPGAGDRVEQLQRLGDVRVDADGHLECAVADRRVGDRDPGREFARMLFAGGLMLLFPSPTWARG